MRSTAVLVLLALLLSAQALTAQAIGLRLAATGATEIAALIGDTLTVEVAADLGTLRASGLALHVQLPGRGLELVAHGGRPFRPGMFATGVEFANQQVPREQTFGVPASAALLTYAVVLGPAEQRFRSGTGVVAAFDVVCTAPVSGAIAVFHSPAHASIVVLDDGRTELAVRAATAVSLTVIEPAAKRSSSSWGFLKARVGR